VSLVAIFSHARESGRLAILFFLVSHNEIENREKGPEREREKKTYIGKERQGETKRLTQRETRI